MKSVTFLALFLMDLLCWRPFVVAFSVQQQMRSSNNNRIRILVRDRRSLSNAAGATTAVGSPSTTSSCLPASFLKRDWKDPKISEQSTTSSISSTIRRRNLVVGTWWAVAGAAAVVVGSTTVRTTTQSSDASRNTLPVVSSSGSTTSSLTTVAEAVAWIDEHCDRRFLHAVVASENRFLYRGVDEPDRISVFRQVTPDLLLPGTYGGDPGALPFFERLETLLREDAVKPSNGHLATTSAQDAAVWGSTAASIWPRRASSSVDEVHYAWFQDGGLFYPRASSLFVDRNSIIVDGRDCGKDSLEDALRGESLEIMFSASSFLAVPISKDAELREQLRKAFLV